MNAPRPEHQDVERLLALSDPAIEVVGPRVSGESFVATEQPTNETDIVATKTTAAPAIHARFFATIPKCWKPIFPLHH